MRISSLLVFALFLMQISCTLSASISNLNSLNSGGGSAGSTPILNIISPMEDTLIDSSKVSSSTVSGTCSEEDVSVKLEVYYSPSDSTPAASYTSVCNSGNVTFNPDLTNVNDTVLYVYLKQTNSAGIVGKSAPLKVNKKAQAPTVNFATTPSVNVISGTIQVTVTFSESVTGFDASQLAPSNAVVQNFSGSGSSYTFDLVPIAEGNASVSILSGITKDSIGNLIPSGYVVSRYYDKDVVRAYFQERISSHDEGNQSVSRTILLTGAKPYDMSVHIEIFGNVVSGVDYSSPAVFDVTIPANATQVSFNLDLLGNSTYDQGDRTLVLNISDTSSPMLRVNDVPYTRINILEDDRTVNYGPVEDVTMGYYHTCIKHQSGVIKCWGNN
ncbi:MAG: hypothetical protein JNM24_11715, partial [Bdellovibrionaceae bacterium]|nr:hypothetical protein [Pseudobdellovibrionaceae bacterium]